MSKPFVYKVNSCWWMVHKDATSRHESWVAAMEDALLTAHLDNTAAAIIEHGRREVDDALARLSIDTPPDSWGGAWP